MRQMPTPAGGTPTIAALGRALVLLETILGDREGRSVSALAAGVGLPKATAHRQVATLIKENYLRRLGNGRLVAGPRLMALAQQADPRQVIAAAAAPILHRLAARLGCVAQLGTLENDMVTYRVKTGRGAGDFFTRVGLQLEAYCTGIGKVLLANLPLNVREAYLSTGPFPALTPSTITDPAELRTELEKVRANALAVDAEEIAVGLVCFAVPIRMDDGRVIAAISVSVASESAGSAIARKGYLAALRQAATRIEREASIALTD